MVRNDANYNLTTFKDKLFWWNKIEIPFQSYFSNQLKEYSLSEIMLFWWNKIIVAIRITLHITKE